MRSVTRRAWAREKERIKKAGSNAVLGKWTPREIRQIQVRFQMFWFKLNTLLEVE